MSDGEIQKIDYLADILEKSNVGKLIEKENFKSSDIGRNTYNPYKLFMAIIYCFAMHKGTLRNIEGSHHQKFKGSKLYQFEGCLNCPYEYKCREKTKDRTTNIRKYQLNIKEQIYREQAKENLLSIKGIEIRINRSIQVEGTFGDLKQNLGYIRFRRRGLEGVLEAIMTMCLAINIRKLFSNYKKDKIEESVI